MWAAQQRAAASFPDDPLIAGFDVAGRGGMFNLPAARSDAGEPDKPRRDAGGSGAWNVIAFRRGLDARTIPPVRISGAPGKIWNFKAVGFTSDGDRFKHKYRYRSVAISRSLL